MIKVKVASLVEGDGEVGAVPVLLCRIINSIDPTVIPIVPRGFRHPSGSIRRPGGLERAVSAVSEIHAGHAILVLIDSDDDCPSDLCGTGNFVASGSLRFGGVGLSRL